MNALAELVAGRPPLRLFTMKEVGERARLLQEARREELIGSQDFSRALHYLLLYGKTANADDVV